LAVILCALSGVSGGETNESARSVLDNRFQLRLGEFFPNLDSSVRMDADFGRPGDGLDFERDLGLSDSKETFYGGVSWRFSPRHILELEYFDFARGGITTADRAWDIGNTTVLATGQIASTIDMRITRLTYQYMLLKDSKKEMSIMLGTHIARFSTSLALSGDLFVNGTPVFVLPEQAIVEVAKTELPLPHLGFNMNYAFTPRLTGTAMLLGFALEIDDYDGSLVEANLALQYRIGQHFGIGGGLKAFFLDVTENRNNIVDFKSDFDFYGPAIFATFTF
jgi:hypothetical protein